MNDPLFWEYADAPDAPNVPIPRSGKWLLFASSAYHDEVWSKIKDATEAGRLGYAAKTTSRSRPDYRVLKSMVTCVLTYDFEDRDNVRRVLATLRELGFTQRLAYKTDADTADLLYGEGVSTYVSPKGSLELRRPTPD